ncbi:MAG: hypothetical protein KC561_05735 [Myxococcales bacterium]|nr:hypothetical protein [Myxococcales bacterium]
MKNRRLAAFLLILLCLWASRAAAEDLRETVDADTFFLAEPAWILGLQQGVGYDSESWFPEEQLSIGYQFASHYLVSMLVGLRPSGREHLQLALKIYVAFLGGEHFSFGMGVTPGVMWRFQPLEFGFCPTWGLSGRYTFDRHHSLTLGFDIDLLFRDLGFRETTQFYTLSLGWLYRF